MKQFYRQKNTSKLYQNFLPEHCNWCPLQCGVNRAAGQVGLCGASDTVMVARSALHFWEEPSISGLTNNNDMVSGMRPGSGTIFFSNCNMKCVYCQNYEISGIEHSGDAAVYKNKTISRGKAVSIEDLSQVCLDLQEQGAMNINFVTGTHYRDQIIEAVNLAKSKGLILPIVWNTSAFETPVSVSKLSSVVDIWLPDFKYSDASLGVRFSQNPVKNYPVVALTAIEAMVSKAPKLQFDTYKNNCRIISGVVVRHMLLPGYLENSMSSLKMLFRRFGNQIKYSIMNQYTPCICSESETAIMYPELLHIPSESEYEQLLDYADGLGIQDYYWQQGGACEESFIPEWN